MSGTTDVLDLVERWAGVLDQETSFRGGDNSGRFRLTLVAVQPADRWLLANAHIGMLQPAGPPAS